MPLDPTLGELSDQQLRPPAQPAPLSQDDISSMTHQPQPQRPNPVKDFIDYAQQPVPASPAPWQEKIDQAAIRQNPGYIPVQPPEQKNWQNWIEQALNFMPAGLAGTLKLRPIPRKGGWGRDQYELIHQETGQKRGDVWLTYDPKEKNLKVGMLESTSEPNLANRFRRQYQLGENPLQAILELKSALPDAFNYYPDMKTVSWYGVGGAKGKQGISADLKYEVNKDPNGEVTWKKIKHDLYGAPRPPAPSQPTLSQPTLSQPPAPTRPPDPDLQQMAQRHTEEMSQHGTAQQASPRQQMDETARRHLNEYATQREINETWDQMRQRQDAEWSALMQRLFGNR